MGPTTIGWHTVAVVPELDTLASAAAAMSPSRAHRAPSLTSSTISSFAASLADFSSPDGTIDGRYALRSVGHGPVCSAPSGPMSQILRSAALAVPSIEWLADAMLPKLVAATAAAEAAGLGLLPLAPLVSDEADDTHATRGVALPPPKASRVMITLGSFFGGSAGVSNTPAAQRTLLADCSRATAVLPTDIARAFGLASVLQVSPACFQASLDVPSTHSLPLCVQLLVGNFAKSTASAASAVMVRGAQLSSFKSTVGRRGQGLIIDETELWSRLVPRSEAPVESRREIPPTLVAAATLAPPIAESSAGSDGAFTVALTSGTVPTVVRAASSLLGPPTSAWHESGVSQSRYGDSSVATQWRDSSVMSHESTGEGATPLPVHYNAAHPSLDAISAADSRVALQAPTPVAASNSAACCPLFFCCIPSESRSMVDPPTPPPADASSAQPLSVPIEADSRARPGLSTRRASLSVAPTRPPHGGGLERNNSFPASLTDAQPGKLRAQTGDANAVAPPREPRGSFLLLGALRSLQDAPRAPPPPAPPPLGSVLPASTSLEVLAANGSGDPAWYLPLASPQPASSFAPSVASDATAEGTRTPRVLEPELRLLHCGQRDTSLLAAPDRSDSAHRDVSDVHAWSLLSAALMS